MHLFTLQDFHLHSQNLSKGVVWKGLFRELMLFPLSQHSSCTVCIFYFSNGNNLSVKWGRWWLHGSPESSRIGHETVTKQDTIIVGTQIEHTNQIIAPWKVALPLAGFMPCLMHSSERSSLPWLRLYLSLCSSLPTWQAALTFMLHLDAHTISLLPQEQGAVCFRDQT